jgi:hypothetical protein
MDGGSYLSCNTSADFKGEKGQNERIIESHSSICFRNAALLKCV